MPKKTTDQKTAKQTDTIPTEQNHLNEEALDELSEEALDQVSGGLTATQVEPVGRRVGTVAGKINPALRRAR